MLAPKPFRTYPDLVTLLTLRNMHIADPARAERKLAQLGYYRLSGYWYPAREFDWDPATNQAKICSISGKPLRQDLFVAGADFDDAVALYQFDKHLRLLMLDAIERLEVNLKSVIAHVVGYHHPMAYTDPKFIQPKHTKNFTSRGKVRNKWNEWMARQQELLNRSTEDSIEWHRRSGRPSSFLGSGGGMGFWRPFPLLRNAQWHLSKSDSGKVCFDGRADLRPLVAGDQPSAQPLCSSHPDLESGIPQPTVHITD